MIKDTAVQILLEHFSEGMVRTIVDAIAEDEREECAKMCDYVYDKRMKAIEAIKEALETKDEPVAWGMEKDGVILDVICPAEHEREEGSYTVPLYITAERTWVGLTDEEIEQIYMDTMSFQQNARALETKLKERNI